MPKSAAFFALVAVAAASCATRPAACAMKAAAAKLATATAAVERSDWPAARFATIDAAVQFREANRLFSGDPPPTGPQPPAGAMKAFLDGPWKKLENAVAQKKTPAFRDARTAALDSCTRCHQATGLPPIGLDPTAETSPLGPLRLP